jgi:hypothetical protein
VVVVRCQELDGVEWEWQAAGAVLVNARMGDLIGPNPTDRGKRGVKRSRLHTTVCLPPVGFTPTLRAESLAVPSTHALWFCQH